MGGPSYPISRDWKGSGRITSIETLKSWIEDRAVRYEFEILPNDKLLTGSFDPEGGIGGIKYLSKTFSWSEKAQGFEQSGSGPAYFGGLYTLATCAWHKRGTAEFSGKGPTWRFDDHFNKVDDEYDLYQPMYPVVLFNSGKCDTPYDPDGAYWVTSVTFVTHAFSSVEGYARFILDRFDGPALEHRLTHAEKTTKYNRNIGDCHADEDAITDGPPTDHDHHEGTSSGCGCSVGGDFEFHPDNWDTHLKCLSLEDFWYPFDVPVFRWSTRGCKIESWDFESMGLHEVV